MESVVSELVPRISEQVLAGRRLADHVGTYAGCLAAFDTVPVLPDIPDSSRQGRLDSCVPGPEAPGYVMAVTELATRQNGEATGYRTFWRLAEEATVTETAAGSVITWGGSFDGFTSVLTLLRPKPTTTPG